MHVGWLDCQNSALSHTRIHGDNVPVKLIFLLKTGMFELIDHSISRTHIYAAQSGLPAFE